MLPQTWHTSNRKFSVREMGDAATQSPDGEITNGIVPAIYAEIR